jgi:rubrerythrin
MQIIIDDMTTIVYIIIVTRTIVCRIIVVILILTWEDQMTKEQRKVRMEEVKKEWAADQNGIPFESVKRGSQKRYQWRCQTCGHEWPASPYNRIRGDTGCPACSGKVVTSKNALSSVRPDLVEWWDFERNKDLTPGMVSFNSHRKVYFKCPDGHSYKRHVYQMVNTGGCKYCSGQAATEDRNLALSHPDLAKQWHPTKNGNLRPEEYLPGSNKKVWWKCGRGHSWEAQISKRALRGDGCPECHSKISLLQVRVYAELKSVFKTAELGPLVHGYEVDVYLPDYRIGVEIDGYPWHSRRLDADIKKSEELRKKDITLLRLRDCRLPEIRDDQVTFEGVINKGHINDLVRRIGITGTNVDKYLEKNGYANDRLFWKLAAKRSLTDPKNSVAYRFPSVAREWDYEANHPALPTQFDAGGAQVAWWKCAKCGERYDARIAHRTLSDSGCPFCSGRKVTRKNSFAGLHPDALADWDWDRNTVDPYTLTPNSNKVVFWKCPEGHEYSTSPKKKLEGLNRWGKYSGCRKCYRRRGSRKK